MEKYITDEHTGLEYELVGDYYLIAGDDEPEERQTPIGIWGKRHHEYLRRNKRITLSRLQISGKLNGYLADIDRQAEEMFSRLVKQMAEAEGVTEQLKADNQMEWVGRMNNIRSRAMEMVNNDLIYARDPAACISTSVETIDPPKVFWKSFSSERRASFSPLSRSLVAVRCSFSR